jgi:hypothetical protein
MRKMRTHKRPSQNTDAPIMSVKTRVKFWSCCRSATSRMSTRMDQGSI